MSSTPVSVVITTLGRRPELLREAIVSILGQRDADGRAWPVELLVVFDRNAPLDLSDVPLPEGSRLRTLTNARTPGLAGGRNTGILAAAHPLIGFCDDDDAWLPGKLQAQVALADAHPEVAGFGGTVSVRTGGRDIVKAVPERVPFARLLRSRVHELHPSAMLYRAEALRGPVGLVDEDLPHGYGEDYEILLRAAREADVHSVTEPVITVLWDRPSYFDKQWRAMAEGLEYILRRFPEFESEPKGIARIAGQVAYARAAMGERREAWRWARSALRRDPAQLRAWAALAVAARLVPAAGLLRLLQRTGRGL